VSEVVDYLVSFAPWIGYVVLTHVLNSWGYGYALGLGLAFVVVVWRTFRHDSRFLDVGTLAFCAVMTIVSLSGPKSPLRPYNLPLSMAAVGAISALSLLIRSPFTFRIARLHVDQEVLKDPQRMSLLYRAHVAATSWWAGSQFTAAGASAICVAGKSGVLATIVQGVGTLLPAGMTRYQHDRGTRQPVEPREDEPAGSGDESASSAPEAEKTDSGSGTT
jgi:hypothetical protein